MKGLLRRLYPYAWYPALACLAAWCLWQLGAVRREVALLAERRAETAVEQEVAPAPGLRAVWGPRWTVVIEGRPWTFQQVAQEGGR